MNNSNLFHDLNSQFILQEFKWLCCSGTLWSESIDNKLKIANRTEHWQRAWIKKFCKWKQISNQMGALKLVTAQK